MNCSDILGRLYFQNFKNRYDFIKRCIDIAYKEIKLNIIQERGKAYRINLNFERNDEGIETEYQIFLSCVYTRKNKLGTDYITTLDGYFILN